MPTNRTKYAVDVLLDPENFPTSDKSVIWDTSSGSFALGTSSGGSAAEVEVGALSASAIATNIQPEYYQIFARSQDGTNTTISGSLGITATVLPAINGDTSGRFIDYRIDTGSTSEDIISHTSRVPHRLESTDEDSPNETFYPPLAIPPRATSYEHVQFYRTDTLSAGMLDITTIEVPQFFGSSSNVALTTNTAETGYTALKIEHTATQIGSTGRSQYCTHFVSWFKDNTGAVQDMYVSSIENARSPQNKYIIDPTRTSGSFDSGGDFHLHVYHFDVDYCYHVFRYMTL